MDQSTLVITIRQEEGGITVVSATGNLDLTTCDQLQEVLKAAGDRTVVDLSGVTFLDSAGLACLLVADRERKERGAALHLSPGLGQAQRVLNITRLEQVLPTFDAVNEAVAAFGNEPDQP